MDQHSRRYRYSGTLTRSLALGDPQTFHTVEDGFVVFYTPLRICLFTREIVINEHKTPQKTLSCSPVKETIGYGLVMLIVEPGSLPF